MNQSWNILNELVFLPSVASVNMGDSEAAFSKQEM